MPSDNLNVSLKIESIDFRSLNWTVLYRSYISSDFIIAEKTYPGKGMMSWILFLKNSNFKNLPNWLFDIKFNMCVDDQIVYKCCFMLY